MNKLNLKLILYIIGLLLVFNGMSMLICSFVSLILDDGVTNELLISTSVPIIIGIILMLFNKNNIRQINKRDGYIIITVGWLTMVISRMLPYRNKFDYWRSKFVLRPCLVYYNRINNIRRCRTVT